MIEAGHVHANLVRATGFQRHFYKCVLMQPLHDLEVTDCFPTRGNNAHLFSFCWMATDRFVDGSFILFHLPFDQREIDPASRFGAYLLSQTLVGHILFGDHNQAGGVLIEA